MNSTHTQITSNFSISLVIAVKNEQDNVAVLANQIDAEFSYFRGKWECIWVDDGSSDHTWPEILKLKGNHRGIKLSRNFGQSAAIMAGISESKGEIIGTIDGDLQNNPKEIIEMLEFLKDDVDLVQGFRDKRKDKLITRRIPSTIANRLARRVIQTEMKDLGCSSRVFRKSILDGLEILGEMHRVFGLYLVEAGARVVEFRTEHRERRFGESKYGLDRTLKFVADLILVRTLRTLSSRPLYLFSRFSLITLTAGLALIGVALLLRLSQIKDFVDSSLVVGGVILVSAAIILMGLGLIAELIARVLISTQRSFHYVIRDRHN